MNYELTADDLQKLGALDAEQRFDYFLTAAVDTQQIWILVDEEGFVLVDAEDDRCIPVWPHAELAQQWINGEWAQCEAQAVDFSVWLDKWTAGLNGDELMIAVFPHAQEPGIVMDPTEFSEILLEAAEDSN